jgi:hypothetical protein
MADLHKRLARTRKRERRKRWERIIRDFSDLSDEEYDQVWKDHAAGVRRRQKRAATELRGEERRERLTELLITEILDLARDYTSDYWWSGRLRHDVACKRVAAGLPPEAKRLFKKKGVGWKTIRSYTRGLRGLRREEFRAAEAHGPAKIVNGQLQYNLRVAEHYWHLQRQQGRGYLRKRPKAQRTRAEPLSAEPLTPMTHE